MRGETDALKCELRGQAAAAFGAKGRGIANAWRSAVHPRASVSLRAAGLVWSNTPLAGSGRRRPA